MKDGVFSIGVLVAAFCCSQGAAFERPQWCENDLNPQEAAICATQELSRLDMAMARAFEEARRTGNPEARYQRLWLRWRATCEVDRACLQRRYVERIVALKAGSESGLVEILEMPGDGDASDVVERRFRDGAFETVYADGRIEWFTNSSSGTIFPDGQQTMMTFIQVEGEFPEELEGDLAIWAEAHETQLAALVRKELGEAAFNQYLAQYAQGGFYQRVNEHIQAIEFFLGEGE
ncbi:MAG: hypothetical protein AAFR98_04815 [Pseudomonadota bacterium]